jgi:hypothetical protein
MLNIERRVFNLFHEIALQLTVNPDFLLVGERSTESVVVHALSPVMVRDDPNVEWDRVPSCGGLIGAVVLAVMTMTAGCEALMAW